MELKTRHLSLFSTVVVVSVVIVLLFMTVEPVNSRPSISEGWTEYHRRFGISDPKRMANYEHENLSREVRELCQRCAKVTKSKLAYPMCILDEEHAREWCSKLLMVG
ncbi:uncharacterized protein LOC110843672 isoform X2 [Folsomia candida]|uniref:Uncharacterized protein n=2 Tax=Folsomia candida TaxID=158441 RepID=A0A226ERS5_FOLCA|nr:uncharacterized protein LOC110843672 isoform X2 [Folsomia candida]OXA60312.1 hypothetical protein Fcan01_05302 [Folsomia candida]